MLRAQIPVSVDDVPLAHARRQKPCPLVQKSALNRIDEPDTTGWKTKAGIAQDPAVERQAVPQISDMRIRRYEGGAGPAIKLHEHRCEPIELPAAQPALLDRAVEHLRLIEARHHDQPIDHLAVAGDCKSTRRTHQRHDAAINIRGKPPIETKLCAASGFTPRQAGEVEIGKADRLLELVGKIAARNTKDICVSRSNPLRLAACERRRATKTRPYR